MKLVIGNKAYSSWSLRPWIVMKAFGVAFDDELVILRDKTTRERILSFSPSGKIPALIDGGVLIWDSLAIIEYIADKHPELAIWPKDRLARAHARCISSEMHSGFQALRNACSMDMTRRFKARDRGEAVAADVARVTTLWREARAKFGGSGPFLYGAFSGADGMYAPVVSRFHSYSIEVDDTSRAYMAAVMAHPAYSAWAAAAVAEPWGMDSGAGDETVIEDLRVKG